jgi:hypothetical protein
MFNDAVYFGEVVKGKRIGKGVMRYKNGRQYEGDWDNDLRNGRGFERYANGNKYIGSFLKGNKQTLRLIRQGPWKRFVYMVKRRTLRWRMVPRTETWLWSLERGFWRFLYWRMEKLKTRRIWSAYMEEW